MASKPTTYEVPQPQFLPANEITSINLANCKQEIRPHPRLFLSDNDNFVVLPDQLRQATPIDFIPPAEGQPFRPSFHRTSSALRPATISSDLFLPSPRPL